MRLNVSSLHTHPHSPTHHPRTTSSAPDIICTYHAHVVSWRKNTSLSRMCVCVCVSKRISTRTSDKAQPSSVPGVGSRKGAAEGAGGVSAVCCRCDVCVFAHWRRKGGGWVCGCFESAFNTSEMYTICARSARHSLFVVAHMIKRHGQLIVYLCLCVCVCWRPHCRTLCRLFDVIGNTGTNGGRQS